MRRIYVFYTKAGPFFIGEAKGRFYSIFKGEHLKAYPTAQSAAEGLSRRKTLRVAKGIDPSALGVSPDIGKWTKLDP